MDNYNDGVENVNLEKSVKTNLEIDSSVLETTRKWAGYMGILTIISGAFACLAAIPTLGGTLIPGVISIILGLKLNRAKESIQRYQNGDKMAINETFENLGTYFKIQVILLIVSFAISIIFVILAILLGIFSGMNY